MAEGRANEYAAAGGPTLSAYLDAVDSVFDRFSVAAVALTAYDPAFDVDGRARAAARALLERVGARVLVSFGHSRAKRAFGGGRPSCGL